MLHFKIRLKQPRYQQQSRLSSAMRCLVLGTLLVGAPAALAIQYKPTNPSPYQGQTKPGAVRGGCSSNQKPGLTALAPIGHVGKTISSRPKLAWFIPDSKSYPAILKLYQYSEAQKWKLVSELSLQSQPGVMQEVFPQDLAIGQVYTWQIIVDCIPGNPSARLADEGQIQRVDPSSALTKKLSSAPTALAKAEIYASEDFWYDALTESLTVTQNIPSQSPSSDLLSSLVDLEQPLLQELLKKVESLKLNCKSLKLDKDQKSLCTDKAAVENRINNLGGILKKLK